jgi:flagellar hook-length control protein FliK
MTISPITPSTDVTVRGNSSSGKDGAPGGFADLLDAVQGRTRDDGAPNTNGADGTPSTDPEIDPPMSKDGTTGPDEASDDTTDDDDSVDDVTPETPATTLLNVTVQTAELLQPDVSPTVEASAPVASSADVTGALAANTGTGTAKTGAAAPTVPVAKAVNTAPNANAAAALDATVDSAIAAQAQAANQAPGVTGGDVDTPASPNGEVPPPGSDDTTPPVSNDPVDPPTTPDVPLLPLEPVLPETPPAQNRTDITSVVDAISNLDTPVPAPARDPQPAPRVSPAPIETAATALAGHTSTIAPPVNQPQHTVNAPAPVEVVHAPPSATPTPPQEQVVAVLSPLQQRPDGVYKLRLELHPAELGRVEIDVELRAGVLHANLRAEHVTAAHALRDALADLRGRLEAQGVRAGNVTVDGRGPGGGDRDRQSGAAGSSGETRRGRTDDPSGNATDDRERRRREIPDANASLLDLRM